jgi:ABC-type multidrug transport system fused ATPase/permease subunit
MNGTFRDNLDGTNIYTDKEIYKVLEECNLLEMVEQKGGLDSRVSN